MHGSEHVHLRAHLIGISLVVFAFLCAAVMNALAKVAVTTIPVGLVLFMQNFFAMCFFSPFCFRKRFAAVRTKRIGLHVLRAITGLLSYACLFIAVKYISLLDATLLANAAPLFFPFVIWVWLGQKVSPRIWYSLLIGFVGVFFILHPSPDFLFRSWMVIVALLGSLFSAIALQCVRNLGTSESPLSIAFFYFLIATIITLPFPLIQWRPLSPNEWYLVIGIGALLGITQFCLAIAYRYASPTLLGPFNYSVVVFAGLIEWWKWNIVPTTMGFLGIVLVCAGGILTLIQQKPKKNSKSVSARR